MHPRRLALALLVALQGCRCEKGPTPPAPPPPTPRAEAAGIDAGTPASGAVLVDKSGVVELQRGSGSWTPAATGDRVGTSDAVRTPGDGEAELSVDGVRIKLRDRSEIRLTAASPGLLRGRVRGRVESDVQRGKGSVSLQVENGSAVASSEGGRFVVTAEGRTAVVAATSGEVEVSAGDRRVQVREGQAARVDTDSLEQPAQALRKVLLAVEWPGDKTNRSSVPVSGRVVAGSRVYVQGEPVEVGPAGEFRVDVRLHDGRQRIAVVTVDPFGRRKSAESDVVLDQSRPQVQMTTPWKH